MVNQSSSAPAAHRAHRPAVQHGENVGVLQAGAEPDLTEEALRAQGGGELGAHDLERDRPVVLQVVGQPDRGHAAAAELALERIAVGQGGLEPFHGVGQPASPGWRPRSLLWRLPPSQGGVLHTR